MSEKAKEKNVILTTRDLVLLFVFFIVVLMIVFTIGLLVGRNFPGEGERIAETDLSEQSMETVEPKKTTVKENLLLPPGFDDKSTSQSDTLSTQARKTTSRTREVDLGDTTGSSRQKPATDKRRANQEHSVSPASTASSRSGDRQPKKHTMYSVQAFASQNYDDAKRKVAELKAKGYDAFVKKPEQGSGDVYFRVQVGKFQNRGNALSRVNRLKKDGYKDAFIRTVVE